MLYTLGLSSNQLHGEIPSELGKLTVLHRLWLQENQLSGQMPPEFGNLAELMQIYVGDNSGLTGCIPASLRDVPDSDLSKLELPFCAQ